MAKPKKAKKLPKDVEGLTTDQVMRAIFGKDGQKQLKSEVQPAEDDPENPLISD